MKFKVKYTKSGNQFFFISNLAEWHFSCRKSYNEKWIEETGQLDYQEKEALKEFGKIMRKYAFKKRKGANVYLGIPFITLADSLAWKKVEEWVDKEEYLKIKEIFNIFLPRFEKIWLSHCKKLASAKLKLEKELNKTKSVEILEIFSILFNDRKLSDKKIRIYLLSSPSEKWWGGGANIGPKSITFECSDIKEDNLSRSLLIIFHEIAHLFERKKFKPLLKRYIDNLSKEEKEEIKKSEVYQEVKDLKIIIKEMIISSLLPEGYLSERLNGKKVIKLPAEKQRTFSNLRHYAAYHLYPLVKEYIERQKPFDEILIQKAWQLFKEFERL